MLHYNVWFTLKDGVSEENGLAVLETFLRELGTAGELADFQLLRNRSEGARTKLPRFQALVQFADNEALARAMKHQAARGIHHGGHGRVIDVVAEFHVETFQVLAPTPFPEVIRACEI